MRPVLMSIAIERTQPSLVREDIRVGVRPNGKGLYQTLERTLCWQAPAFFLGHLLQQLEDRVQLNPKTTAPWRILRSLA